MKYLKLYESWLSKKIDNYKIHNMCKKYKISNYTINNDGSIDSNGDINLWCMHLAELPPIRFNKVNGNFRCDNNRLTSFKGSPLEVNRNFLCHHNLLKSFKGAPKIIRGRFDCRDNKINSFEYFPSFVKHGFYCDYNPIYQVWKLFRDETKIELLNDFDIFRDENTDNPSIVMDRLNDFLLTIGKEEVKKVDQYNNI